MYTRSITRSRCQYPVAFNLDFDANWVSPYLITFAPPRRAPPFLVCTSGAVALKVAQVPSTANLQHEDCNLKVLQ